MPRKLYESKAWLVRQRSNGKSLEEIAKMCNVKPNTIYRWLVKHGLAENRRTW